MDHRILRALDGELPADGLTPHERTELQHHRAIVGTALEPIRRLPTIDVTDAVLRRVRPAPTPLRHVLSAAARWLWAPRALTLRPAYGLGGGLAMAAVVFIALSHPATPAGAPPAAATPAALEAPARMIVQFRLGDTAAREVSLAGDFNGWQPIHRLHEVQPGVWAVDLALAPGVYNYVFVVDGRTWRLDPLAPRVTDGFGGASSRVAVLAPEVRS